MEIEQMVYETLMQASSQHPDMLKPAEQKLREWEIEPGFYSVLFVSKNLIWLVPIIFLTLFKCGEYPFREYFPISH